MPLFYKKLTMPSKKQLKRKLKEEREHNDGMFDVLTETISKQDEDLRNAYAMIRLLSKRLEQKYGGSSEF